ncbi:MAG: hypothetical protein CR979_02780, partial [Propionibacterium sp.]
AVEELFRLAEIEVQESLAAVGDNPEDRLSAYVAAMLRLAQAGHSPNRPISLAGAPNVCRQRIRVLHERLMEPLVGIVMALGAKDAQVSTALASGTIQGAVQMVEHGADLEAVTTQTKDFLRQALARA